MVSQAEKLRKAARAPSLHRSSLSSVYGHYSRIGASLASPCMTMASAVSFLHQCRSTIHPVLYQHTAAAATVSIRIGDVLLHVCRLGGWRVSRECVASLEVSRVVGCIQ